MFGSFVFVTRHKEYIKIGISGILSIAIISSVYSFLTNVEIIHVMPDANQVFIDDSWNQWSVKGGISCIPNAYGLHPDYSYCNTVTDEMYNTLIDHDEWRCELYTDYSDKPFLESFMFKFTSFKIYLAILIVSALFYGIFSIIHDWTLVKYKARLDFVSFLPDHQTLDDFHLLFPVWKCSQICHCDCCLFTIIWMLIFILPLLICCILEVLYIHIIWPIIAMLQSSCYNKQQKHKILTISYISAQWVGVSCFMMGAATMQQMQFISTGFSFDIPSLNPSQCECSCNYIFAESDYYKLLFTTFIFVVLTMNFLYSWTMETFHGNHFLYLIKYSIPIKQANKINPNECTGSMMVNLSNSTQNNNNNNDGFIDYQHVNDINDEDDEKQSLFGTKEKNEVIDEVLIELGLSGDVHGSLTTGIFRSIMFISNAVYLVLAICEILLNGVINNFYQYPKWGKILGYIGSGIMLLSWLVVYIGLGYHFLKLLIPRIMMMFSKNESDDNELRESLRSELL